jgi:hypothetical protein
MFHPLTAFVSLVAAMAKVHIKLPSTRTKSMLPHILKGDGEHPFPNLMK